VTSAFSSARDGGGRAAEPEAAVAGSAAASPAPRRLKAPGWLDLRLVLGILLVLGSVLVGARVVASSDDRVGVWQATRSLAAGIVLSESDVEVARVRLPPGDAYLRAAEPIAGRMLIRPIGEGELVPAGGVGVPSTAMTVTIPVLAAEAPSVERGQRITVWVSTASCRGVVVLSDVVVQDAVAPRSGGLSTSSRLAIAVRVEPDAAARVVQALDLPSAVIRIGVLSASAPVGSAPGSAADLLDLAGCESVR
jgi:hypothetical protein